ncbi:MAG: alpha/beta hydrolase family protein [Betaproteobacteria bacterium]
MTTFVFAHGAGGHRDDRGMLQLTKVLESEGMTIVRFNFPYREQGAKRPDPMPVLKARMQEVAAQVHDQPLLIGGRSMGGRVATMLAADGLACDGLLLFAYPLHPAGRPEKLRDRHLADIKVPVLCFNGTRDALCRRELMEKALEKAQAWTMHWLEGADHSFKVLKSSGRREEDVLAEISAAIQKWVRSYPF